MSPVILVVLAGILVARATAHFYYNYQQGEYSDDPEFHWILIWD